VPDPAARLERSVLLVPASNARMIEKAATSAADAVCIDLEDAVAPSEKEASRANVIHALMYLDFGHSLRMFRMNALDTPFAYRDLIEVVEAIPKSPSGKILRRVLRERERLAGA